MATAVAPNYIRKRGFEDFYLDGKLELKGGLLIGGDLDLQGGSIIDATILGLDSDAVANQSGVAGATVTAALDELAGAGSFSPLTTKGDLFGFGADNDRLPVGIDGAGLQADAASPLGVRWVAGLGAVTSVFGRAGAVFPVAGDYDASEVGNDSAVVGTHVADALNTLLGLVVPPAPVDSVFGRVGVVNAVGGDYASSQVDNNSGVVGATVSDALDTLAAASVAFPLRAPDGSTSTPSYSFANETGSGMTWVGGFLQFMEGGSRFMLSDGDTLEISKPLYMNIGHIFGRLENLTAVVATGVEGQAATGSTHVFEGAAPVTRTLILSTVNLGAFVTYVNNGTADLSIQPQGGDGIVDAGAIINPLVIEPGNAARLVASSAGDWTVIFKSGAGGGGGGGGAPTVESYGTNQETIVATKVLTDASPTVQVLFALAPQDIELPAVALTNPQFVFINEGPAPLTVFGADATRYGEIPPFMTARVWGDGLTRWWFAGFDEIFVSADEGVGFTVVFFDQSPIANDYMPYEESASSAIASAANRRTFMDGVQLSRVDYMLGTTVIQNTFGVLKNGALSESIVPDVPGSPTAITSVSLVTAYSAGDFLSVQMTATTGVSGAISLSFYVSGASFSSASFETTVPFCGTGGNNTNCNVGGNASAANGFGSDELNTVRVSRAGTTGRVVYDFTTNAGSFDASIMKNGGLSEVVSMAGTSGVTPPTATVFADEDEFNFRNQSGVAWGVGHQDVELVQAGGGTLFTFFGDAGSNGNYYQSLGYVNAGGSNDRSEKSVAFVSQEMTLANFSYFTDQVNDSSWTTTKNGADDQTFSKGISGSKGPTVPLTATAFSYGDQMSMRAAFSEPRDCQLLIWTDKA